MDLRERPKTELAAFRPSSHTRRYSRMRNNAYASIKLVLPSLERIKMRVYTTGILVLCACGAFVLLMFAPFHAAASQEIASLRTGESIRLSVGSPSSQRIEGTLVSVSADTIVLRAPTNPPPIGFSDVRLLEVKRRSGGSFMKSVAFGLLGGVLSGAILGLASGSTDTGDGILTAQDKALIGSVLGGAAGLIGGTLFGACCSSGWESVPLPRSRAPYSTR